MPQVVVEILDELSAVLAEPGRDLSRTVVETLAVQAYRERKLSTNQLGRLLRFETGHELDGFLKQHEVWLDYSLEDLDNDRQAHRNLGI